MRDLEKSLFGLRNSLPVDMVARGWGGTRIRLIYFALDSLQDMA